LRRNAAVWLAQVCTCSIHTIRANQLTNLATAVA
jgi:hypothetical protein